ncbi:ferredoxin, partial [Mycobacterium eburneum]
PQTAVSTPERRSPETPRSTGIDNSSGVEADLFERLPTPFGLIRAGVAPDHQNTKAVVDVFGAAFANTQFGCHFNVEVGRDITHDELLAHYHAVIYAVGASKSRELGIAGEQLPGNHAAADFVAWYNGHPDHAHDVFDLSAERAVIVGNGNVALDVARVLLMSPDELAKTDIADHALAALSQSSVREVVILGRRTPRDAAYSVGEFLALGHLPEIDVVIDSDDLTVKSDDDIETALKVELAREFSRKETSPERKRIVFRFMTSPVEVVGDERVMGVRVITNSVGRGDTVVSADIDDGAELIETSLFLRSIGYMGSAIDGLPFDDGKGVVPNDDGRVIDSNGQPVPGVYVTGWIKRGPSGVIGTNRSCAQETVARLWVDFDAGLLTRNVGHRSAVGELLADRGVQPVDWQGWLAIDDVERTRGAEVSRPRVKFVGISEMLAAANR